MHYDSNRGFWAQVLLGALLPLSLAPAFVAFTIDGNRRDYSRIPTVTFAELQRRYDHYHAVANGPVSTDPADYYRMAAEERQLEAIQEKFHDTYHGPVTDRFLILTMPDMGPLTRMQMAYTEHFGTPAMAEAADRTRSWVNARIAACDTTPLHTDPNVWTSFVFSLLASYAVAFLFFMTRLKNVGLRIWPELFTPTLYAYVLAWPFGVFRYPRHINPLEQVRRVKRYLTGLLWTALSFGSVTPALAGDRKTDSSTASDTTLVMNDQPKPAFSLSSGIMSDKLVVDGTRVHSGAVAWFDANVSYAGWSVDHWRSRAFSGSTGSDENDYSISKSWTAGTWNASATFAYYDIRPIGSGKGGDMLSPILSVSHALGNGLTAFATGEAYVMTGGPKGRNGYDVSVGAKASRVAGPVSVDVSVSSVYADGPFKFDRGVSLRGDASASIPLIGKLRALVSAKGYAPFVGAHDRHRTGSISAGLAYAF